MRVTSYHPHSRRMRQSRATPPANFASLLSPAQRMILHGSSPRTPAYHTGATDPQLWRQWALSRPRAASLSSLTSVRTFRSPDMAELVPMEPPDNAVQGTQQHVLLELRLEGCDMVEDRCYGARHAVTEARALEAPSSVGQSKRHATPVPEGGAEFPRDRESPAQVHAETPQRPTLSSNRLLRGSLPRRKGLPGRVAR